MAVVSRRYYTVAWAWRADGAVKSEPRCISEAIACDIGAARRCPGCYEKLAESAANFDSFYLYRLSCLYGEPDSEQHIIARQTTKAQAYSPQNQAVGSDLALSGSCWWQSMPVHNNHTCELSATDAVLPELSENRKHPTALAHHRYETGRHSGSWRSAISPS